MKLSQPQLIAVLGESGWLGKAGCWNLGWWIGGETGAGSCGGVEVNLILVTKPSQKRSC